MAILNRLFKLVKTEKNKQPKQYKKDLTDIKIIETVKTLPHPELFEGLDDGQKSAVLSKNPRILVLAGAGAGKTKVLLCRIEHLLKNCDVKPANILAMTFTKDATFEMIDRLIGIIEPKYLKLLKGMESFELKILREELKQKYPETRLITISTIHSLCCSILRTDGAKIFNQNFKVITDEEKTEEDSKEKMTQQKILRAIISEIAQDDQEFIEKIKKFIYDYLIDYEKLKDKKDEPSKGSYTTLDGKQVRSKSERDIANFLVQHKIKYYYEKEATWVDKDDSSRSYRPDFYLPEYDTYIEHWWVSSSKDVVPDVFKEKFDKEKYLKEREWKLSQFKKHHKILIQSNKKNAGEIERIL